MVLRANFQDPGPVTNVQDHKPWEFFDVSVFRKQFPARLFPIVQERSKIKHQVVGLGSQYLFGRKPKILAMVNPWDDFEFFFGGGKNVPQSNFIGGELPPPSQTTFFPLFGGI